MHFDETFLVFMSLIIFLVIVVYLRIPSILLSFLDAHADKIRDDIFEARRLREKSENILMQYKEKHSKVEEETREIILAAKHRAKILAEEVCQNIEQISALYLKDLEQKIHYMKLEAKRLLYAKIADFSVEIVREIISQKMNDDVNSSIFEKTISSIQSCHQMDKNTTETLGSQ
ncbi:F0F1 ATP synthase subunit B [Candidatus Liberibacter asiaticus]